MRLRILASSNSEEDQKIKLEVKEIDCKGLEFDPNKMEAVLTDSDKNLPSNVVIEVLQKGYTYKDKVIRVAMVKVNE